MKQYEVSASKSIEAPSQAIYDTIADYHEGHQAIIPRRYFKEMKVLEGGIGAGTRVAIEMEVMGVSSSFELDVTEPEPGRVLVETDPTGAVETTFTVEPLTSGSSTVTIHSKMSQNPGVGGWIEAKMTQILTRRIYREELDQLAEVMASRVVQRQVQ